MKASQRTALALAIIATASEHKCTDKQAIAKLPLNDRTAIAKDGQAMHDRIAAIRDERAKKAAKLAEKALAKRFGMALPAYRKAYAAAKELARYLSRSTDYSMGAHGIVTVGGEIFAAYDGTANYSRSCKYKARHGRLSVELTKHQLRRLEIIGGVPTIVGEIVAHGIRKAFRVHLTGNYGMRRASWEPCYITGGYHAKSIGEAMDWRREQAARLWGQRRASIDRNKAMSRFVGLSHARAAGLCDFGIEAFANRHHLSMDMGYRLDYLRSLEPSNGYVELLIDNVASL